MDFESILLFVSGWFAAKLKKAGHEILNFIWVLSTKPAARVLMVAVFLPVAAIISTRLIQDGAIKKLSTMERIYGALNRADAYVERHLSGDRLNTTERRILAALR